MFRKCVFTTAGFSMGGASFLALRRRLIRARGFLFRPSEMQVRVESINSNLYIYIGEKGEKGVAEGEVLSLSLSPLEKRLRALACTSVMSCS